jgi:ABC-2 type transport system permease protein
MKNIFTVIKRELDSYFNSAIAYIYLIVFIVLNNGLFMANYFLAGRADMRAYFNNLPLLLFIFIPVVTMRLWAEDKKEHTFELLLTFPMKPHELVLGKFFASFIFYLIALATTLTVPLVIQFSGRPDPGAIIAGYLGSLLLGSLFLAMGIFISGLVQEQIVAFILSTLGCFVFFIAGTDFVAVFLDGWIYGLGTFFKNYIGAALHLNSFAKGVIDLKDVLYFVISSAAFLLLNGFFLESRFRPKAKFVFTLTALTSILGLIIFNWLVYDLNLGRFDITEDKIYTVSDSAKSILKELKAPVSVNLYITPAEKMPTTFKTLEADIVGKLEELKVASKNKFNFKVAHIEAARLLEQKKKEDAAENETDSLEKTLKDKGIVPFQVESVNKDEVGVKLIYSALTLNYKEKPEEVLPRILPNSLADLEYLLFSRIMKLIPDKKPKIALFSPLKPREIDVQISHLLSAAEKDKPQFEDVYKTLLPLMRNNGYDVTRIALTKDDPIPEELSTFIVINPAELNGRQLYEINKFLYQGGAVFIAAQGFDYSFQMAGSSGLEVSATKRTLDVNNLIKKWGVGINEEMLMDENSQIIEVSTGQRVGPFALSMPIKVPNQITVSAEEMNKNMGYVLRLPSLLYLWGSALDVSEDVLKGQDLKKQVIFTSSGKSWKVPYKFSTLQKEDLEFPKNAAEAKFTLGLLLEGQFSNTFKDADLPEWPDEKAKTDQSGEPAQPKKAEKAQMDDPKPGRLIVIGCAKMFDDELITSPGNLSLFGNIVDGLTLGDKIVKIRAKSYFSRALKKLTDSQKVFYRFLTIFLVPILLTAFAFLRLFLRRKEKQFYLAAQER